MHNYENKKRTLDKFKYTFWYVYIKTRSPIVHALNHVRSIKKKNGTIKSQA